MSSNQTLSSSEWTTFLTSQGAEFDLSGNAFFDGKAFADSSLMTFEKDDNQNKGQDENINNKIYLTDLSPLGILVVSGKDARKFLQGQVTCDINAVTLSHSLPGAHCNLKGRAIFSFRAIELPNDNNESTIALIIPKELIDVAHKALSKFIVFSKATISISDDLQLFGLLGKTANTLTNTLPKLAKNTQLISFAVQPHQVFCLAPIDIAKETWKALSKCCQKTNVYQWQLTNIQNGIAGVLKATSEEFLPQMLNYDKTGGVSFKKGCYIGQEVIARMQYKGKLKRHLYRFSVEHLLLPITPGIELYSDETTQSIGNIVMITPIGPDSFEFLAVITDDAFNSQNVYLEQEKLTKLQCLSLPML